LSGDRITKRKNKQTIIKRHIVMTLIFQKTLTSSTDEKKGILCSLEFELDRGYFMLASSCSIVGHLSIVSLSRGNQGSFDLVPCERQSQKKKDSAIAMFEERLTSLAERYQCLAA
jgi:hypothetical protein